MLNAGDVYMYVIETRMIWVYCVGINGFGCALMMDEGRKRVCQTREIACAASIRAAVTCRWGILDGFSADLGAEEQKGKGKMRSYRFVYTYRI